MDADRGGIRDVLGTWAGVAGWLVSPSGRWIGLRDCVIADVDYPGRVHTHVPFPRVTCACTSSVLDIIVHWSFRSGCPFIGLNTVCEAEDS